MDLYTLMADNAFILEKSIVIMLAELQDMEIFKKTCKCTCLMKL